MTTLSSTQVAELVNKLSFSNELDHKTRNEITIALESLVKERDELSDTLRAVNDAMKVSPGQCRKPHAGLIGHCVFCERDSLLSQKDQLEKTVLGLMENLIVPVMDSQDLGTPGRLIGYRCLLCNHDAHVGVELVHDSGCVFLSTPQPANWVRKSVADELANEINNIGFFCAGNELNKEAAQALSNRCMKTFATYERETK